MKIIQWRVRVGNDDMEMFTQTHDPEAAALIACATFGKEVCELEDEGACTQELYPRLDNALQNEAERAYERHQQNLMESGGVDDSKYRRDMIDAGRGHLL